MEKMDNESAFLGSLGLDALRLAFETQRQLLEHHASAALSPLGPGRFQGLLEESAAICRRSTGAWLSALILFDKEGEGKDIFLSCEEALSEANAASIEHVLRERLTGWAAPQRAARSTLPSTANGLRIQLSHPFDFDARVLWLPIGRARETRGALALIHRQADPVTRETAVVMQLAAQQIALVIDNARLVQDLNASLRKLEESQVSCEAYSQRLDQEMEKGRQLQMDFLPEKLPRLEGWEVQDFFFPANRASGDFYDAFLLREGYLGIVIADVCDKGVGAALFMGLFRSLIRIFSGQARLGSIPVDPAGRTVGGKVEGRTGRRRDPVQALRTVALTNDYIAREHGEMGMFATLFFGVLDPADGNLFYVNGGHEPVFVLDQGGIKEELVRTGPAVGLFAETRFGFRQIRLAPGDLLLGYTDGVVDACSSTGERFGRKRLVDRLSGGGATPGKVVERIATDLFAHIGMAPQEDDITMLALQRKTGGAG